MFVCVLVIMMKIIDAPHRNASNHLKFWHLIWFVIFCVKIFIFEFAFPYPYCCITTFTYPSQDDWMTSYLNIIAFHSIQLRKNRCGNHKNEICFVLFPSGSIGGVNLEEIDNRAEPFVPLTAKRSQVPRYTDTAQ